MKNTFKLGRTNNQSGVLSTSSEYKKFCLKYIELLLLCKDLQNEHNILEYICKEIMKE